MALSTASSRISALIIGLDAKLSMARAYPPEVRTIARALSSARGGRSFTLGLPLRGLIGSHYLILTNFFSECRNFFLKTLSGGAGHESRRLLVELHATLVHNFLFKPTFVICPQLAISVALVELDVPASRHALDDEGCRKFCDVHFHARFLAAASRAYAARINARAQVSSCLCWSPRGSVKTHYRWQSGGGLCALM